MSQFIQQTDGHVFSPFEGIAATRDLPSARVFMGTPAFSTRLPAEETP